jgi:mono/diheme cytochrome c family protein
VYNVLIRTAKTEIPGINVLTDGQRSMQEEDPVTRLPFALAILWTSLYAGSVYAQTPARVEFGRDILPILRQNCIACHGSSQQSSGLRLDRKSSVLRVGDRRVVPGSSENSFLYHRLVGSQFGMQMPPTGPLRPEDISLIRRWIEEGAEWPDALANEADVPPPDPRSRHCATATGSHS